MGVTTLERDRQQSHRYSCFPDFSFCWVVVTTVVESVSAMGSNKEGISAPAVETVFRVPFRWCPPHRGAYGTPKMTHQPSTRYNGVGNQGKRNDSSP